VVTGHCPEIGCFLALQRQCSMLVGILLACSIGLSIVEGAQVWLALKLEDRKLQKNKSEGDEVRHRSFLEEQSKYAPFNMRAQIENMLQLVIGLGFVLLFGTLQPMVAPLCLIHFACALRFRAMLLTWRFTKRPLPLNLAGVGAWANVMGVLMNFGIFFSGVLVVLWGRFFHGALLIAKISGLVLWFVLISGMWALVDIIVSPKSPQAQVMIRRRNHATRVITEASMASHYSVTESQRRPSTVAEEAATTPRAKIDEDVPDSFGDSSSGLGSGSDGDKEEVLRRPEQSLNRRATLSLTDAATTRRMEFELGCDVGDLMPQAEIVQMEAWQDIRRLDGELTSLPATPRRRTPTTPPDDADDA